MQSPTILYKTCIEILRRNFSSVRFYDSPKKSDMKILKIHVKKWFKFYYIQNSC